MKKLTILAATLALSASASAFAVTAQSGVYVQGVGGWSYSARPDKYEMAADGIQNNNYAWGGNIGYDYAINQNVLAGIEGGYLNLGTTKYTFSSADVATGPGAYAKAQNWGYQVLATATYLMNNGFNGFVKAGGIYQKSTLNETLTSPTTYYPAGMQQKWIPAAAIGVGYMPTQNLNVALQYEHTFGSKWNNPFPSPSATSINPGSKPMTQDIITLGVSYKFAM
jgi:opacity protein-like surface antigen